MSTKPRQMAETPTRFATRKWGIGPRLPDNRGTLQLPENAFHFPPCRPNHEILVTTTIFHINFWSLPQACERPHRRSNHINAMPQIMRTYTQAHSFAMRERNIQQWLSELDHIPREIRYVVHPARPRIHLPRDVRGDLTRSKLQARMCNKTIHNIQICGRFTNSWTWKRWEVAISVATNLNPMARLSSWMSRGLY